MSVAIEYRMPPAYLPTSSIIAELFWLGDAVTWAGPVGEYAQTRTAALRDELRRREWVRS